MSGGDQLDFTCQNLDDGTLFLLWPVTERARTWAKENFHKKILQWSNAIPIDPKLIDAVADRIIDAGFRWGSHEPHGLIRRSVVTTVVENLIEDGIVDNTVWFHLRSHPRPPE